MVKHHKAPQPLTMLVALYLGALLGQKAQSTTKFFTIGGSAFCSAFFKALAKFLYRESDKGMWRFVALFVALSARRYEAALTALGRTLA